MTAQDLSGSAAAAEGGEGRGGEPGLVRRIGPALLLLFIVGDILGTGVYALTGKVAKEVGGAVWLPFLCAFIVAILTAFSYLELVTKYPKAGGAAVYTHRAFNVHFLTFLVCFTVMCSGLTSASSASKAFAGNLSEVIGWGQDNPWLLWMALGFMLAIAGVNFRGVAESVKLNVVLTIVELTGLLIIIGIGAFAIMRGLGDTSQLTQIRIPEGETAFGAVTAATALAFFAMVGFEDSVNMAEETKDPVRIFPKIMLTGLVITGVIYVLVAISAVTLVPPDQLGEGDAPLLKVVAAGAPSFPVGIFAFITMFAVANSALINMLMASRLLYGMAHEEVLPRPLGKVHPGRRTPWVAIIFTTAIAFGLIFFADLAALGGTTSLLLLCVFTIVNIAVLVLRSDKVEHNHFHSPTIISVAGAILCAFLASPLSGRDGRDYQIGGVLMLIGIGLWALTWFVNRAVFAKPTYAKHPESLGGHVDEKDDVH
ncbi:amino acid transporter [Kineosphaera limosa]|uniref:Putative amino acid transporter n=1 Tax=Kineosphaera limosa NBRC 100340 TaxID=1184609 RepID=K6WVG4_9MICO|nr:APC family permease [Kineosphaera limosa]NYD98999.1 amino acid transporter [Kineosphaera limosa]GAB97796.1 putative amino acid transporter [Kineosphaera limosa NBRC 100340]